MDVCRIFHRAGQSRGLIDRGQATAEYVLVMLGAAAVALLVLAWATSTSKISTLLDRVVDSLLSGVV